MITALVYFPAVTGILLAIVNKFLIETSTFFIVQTVINIMFVRCNNNQNKMLLVTLVINMIREPYGNTKMMIADMLSNIKSIVIKCYIFVRCWTF